MATLREAQHPKKGNKLGVVSGVYIPVCLSILSILMFLRFGLILGQIGLLGILGLLVVAYVVDLVTTLSLSAIASNGEVKGGGAYYLISRSLGPEFGGSIGLLFYLSQVLNTALNVVGLIDCIRLNVGASFPQGYWQGYALQTVALIGCTCLCLAGSAIFARASNALLFILLFAIASIPVSAILKRPFHDEDLGIEFTGMSLGTLRDNLLPHTNEPSFNGLSTFRDLFGILFPATSGIFAGASMSGDLRNPSKSIPRGTLWAMLTTFVAYVIVILSMASSTTHSSFLNNTNVIPETNLSAPVIFAGECAVTLFSALMGVIGSAKLLQALSRDKLLPGLTAFGYGSKKGDEPIFAIFLTYVIAQFALLADLNQIATFIAMGYQMTFFVMNLACFLLKIGSAPNFRPGFKFFNWQSALAGSCMSAAAMFFIDETYAAAAICLLVFLFSLIHFLSPPKRWGDVSQNLIYHQVRKYLLRLKPEHIKFWRPQIILLVNNPRRQTRLIQLCNSMKKGALYILGHVIVTDDFNSGVHEAKLQQHAWANFISEVPRLKAFVQLTMSPSITWGIRNLILSAGLGGMRPNIAVLGFYNMDELRRSRHDHLVPSPPGSPAPGSGLSCKAEGKSVSRRRGDTSARILEGFLPTDVIRTEEMMSPTSYMTILEDLALRYKLNVAVGKGCEKLETPRQDGSNTKRYIDLWPIQMSAEILTDGKNILTTNFDTYTLILQLGYILNSVPAWRKAYQLRVLVFVEYESEVNEEVFRVKVLLDKLRIEAQIHVFWLASGELHTYEVIINGSRQDVATEMTVNRILREEDWWGELRRIRGRSDAHITASQEMESLNTIREATAGRPGIYNPHIDVDELARRRSSVIDLRELQSKPSVSKLARLGLNVGIHTHRLTDEVFDEQIDHLDQLDSDGENSGADGTDGDSSDSDYSAASDGEVEDLEAPKQPLLGSLLRRKSFGDALLQRGLLGRKLKTPARQSRASERRDASSRSYGTISSQPSVEGRSGQAHVQGTGSQFIDEPRPGRPERSSPMVTLTGSTKRHPGILEGGPPEQQSSSGLAQSQAGLSSPLNGPLRYPVSQTRPADTSMETSPKQDFFPDRNPPSAPARPPLSRQSSAVRFSSKPLPETKTNVEDPSGPTIMFADSSSAPLLTNPGTPAFSRHSSTGRLSDQLGSNVWGPAQEKEAGPSVSAPSLHHARTDSARTLNPDGRRPYESAEADSPTGGAPCPTQGMPFSFNELPSRAQHLILNELIRKNSEDTALVFTTLPVPSEGTCLDEDATLKYLSDVEVLCNDLPPVLLVLSNSMTVTVGL